MKAVREMDHDGLLLCRIQAETFELSVEKAGTSSEIFIRRFMNSEAAQLLDSGEFDFIASQPGLILSDLCVVFSFVKRKIAALNDTDPGSSSFIQKHILCPRFGCRKAVLTLFIGDFAINE